MLILAFTGRPWGRGCYLPGGDVIDPGRSPRGGAAGRCGWWNRLTRIIIPLLVPTIAYFVLINVIWIFVGLFGLVYTVTKGGPGYATTLRSDDLPQGVRIGRDGIRPALSVILFLIVLTISAVQLRTFDRLTTDV